MIRRRNSQRRTLQSNTGTTSLESEINTSDEAPSQNPFLRSAKTEEQIDEKELVVTSGNDKSARPYIITASVSEDNIEALNQTLADLDKEKPAAIVVFPSPGLETTSLEKQLSAPEGFEKSIVKEKTSISAGHIYIVSPSTYVTLEKNTLAMIEQADRNLLSMEVFLTSVAETEKSRSIVLLFTPWIAPFVYGLKQIREQNGLILSLNYGARTTLGIEPAEASLLIDATVLAKQMPARILSFLDSSDADAGAGLSLQQEDIQSLENIYLAILKASGIKCSDFDLIFILKHIQQRLRVHGISSITEYVGLINENPEELLLLSRRLSLNISGFFYERATMKMIAQDIIPDLFDNKSKDVIRAWVPACSTGEDALSLAILLNDYAANMQNAPKVQVVGTDIDAQILEVGKRASFTQNRLHTMPQSFRENYFEQHQDRAV